MTLADGTVAVTAVVALVLSFLAFVYSRRSTLAAETAAAEARRSADAAERSADVAEREEERAREEAEERAVRWALDRVGGATAHLVNTGEGTAYDVRVQVPEAMRVVGGHAAADELPAGGKLPVGVSRRMSAPARSGLTVRWRTRPGGPERSSMLLLP
ncbi:hypothetical protein [Modestobacter sp. SYSU DS0511]